MLVNEDAERKSIVTESNRVVTDTATELLGKQRRKKSPCVTDEILNCWDQMRDLKETRDELEGVKDYRKINKKTRKGMKMVNETWTEGGSMAQREQQQESIPASQIPHHRETG